MPVLEILLERAVRNHDLRLVAVAEQPRRGIVDADHVVGQAADFDTAVHRIALSEHVLGQLGVDDGDVRVRGILEVGERTPRLNGPTFDLRPVGAPAADANGGEAMALEVDICPGPLVDDDEGNGGKPR